jgi:hypothetical protein
MASDLKTTRAENETIICPDQNKSINYITTYEHSKVGFLGLKEDATKNGCTTVQKKGYIEVTEKTENSFDLDAGSINMDNMFMNKVKVKFADKGNVSPTIEAMF